MTAVESDVSIEQAVQQLRALDVETRRAVMAKLDDETLEAVLNHLAKDVPPEKRIKIKQLAEQFEETHMPENDDELHEWFVNEMGIRFPRKRVCTGHCAPFDLVADIIFERGNPDKLAIGNRGSGKTMAVGKAGAASMRLKPNWTGCTVGAVKAQASRCASYLKDAWRNPRWEKYLAKLKQESVSAKNGSAYETVTGTMSGVNSPHPIFGHFDEVELFRPGVFEEGLNMAQSANGYRAMNVLTSSWKHARGFISQTLDSMEEQQRDGATSDAYQVYRWCVWETTAPCTHDCNDCPFKGVIKGQWSDGSPRTFESACKMDSPQPGVGKLKFTDGFVAIEDSVARFRKLSRRVWESQQESKRPSLEGLVYDNWDEERFEIDWWDPKPEYGEFYAWVDQGSTNPFAIGLVQLLDADVTVYDEDDEPIYTVPEGAYVLFDEIYIEDVGNVTPGKMFLEKLWHWESKHPGFIDNLIPPMGLTRIFRDVAARSLALDWARLVKHLGPTFEGEDGETYETFNIPMIAFGNKDVLLGISHVYETVIGRGRQYADRMRCPEFLDELGGYEWPNTNGVLNKTRPVKENDHHMDGMRYLHWGLHLLSRKRKPILTGVAHARPLRMKTQPDQLMAELTQLQGVPEQMAPSGRLGPIVAVGRRSRGTGF